MGQDFAVPRSHSGIPHTVLHNPDNCQSGRSGAEPDGQQKRSAYDAPSLFPTPAAQPFPLPAKAGNDGQGRNELANHKSGEQTASEPSHAFKFIVGNPQAFRGSCLHDVQPKIRP